MTEPKPYTLTEWMKGGVTMDHARLRVTIEQHALLERTIEMNKSRFTRLMWLYVLREVAGHALNFSARSATAGSFETRINQMFTDAWHAIEAEIEVEEAK